MGTVYLAEDARVGQQVAIKTVHADAADFPSAGNSLYMIEHFIFPCVQKSKIPARGAGNN
jgi:hypothetical protein